MPSAPRARRAAGALRGRLGDRLDLRIFLDRRTNSSGARFGAAIASASSCFFASIETIRSSEILVTGEAPRPATQTARHFAPGLQVFTCARRPQPRCRQRSREVRAGSVGPRHALLHIAAQAMSTDNPLPRAPPTGDAAASPASPSAPAPHRGSPLRRIDHHRQPLDSGRPADGRRVRSPQDSIRPS
jgi:hypothetical protein